MSRSNLKPSSVPPCTSPCVIVFAILMPSAAVFAILVPSAAARRGSHGVKFDCFLVVGYQVNAKSSARSSALLSNLKTSRSDRVPCCLIEDDGHTLQLLQRAQSRLSQQAAVCGCYTLVPRAGTLLERLPLTIVE